MWRAQKRGARVFLDNMDTLEQAIEQWRELRACMEALRLVTQSPIALRPVSAVRVLVRHAAILLHAARSAIEDSAARFLAHLRSRASIGTAARGSWLLCGGFLKGFESQVPA
jgi:hypothetical protein